MQIFYSLDLPLQSTFQYFPNCPLNSQGRSHLQKHQPSLISPSFYLVCHLPSHSDRRITLRFATFLKPSWTVMIHNTLFPLFDTERTLTFGMNYLYICTHVPKMEPPGHRKLLHQRLLCLMSGTRFHMSASAWALGYLPHDLLTPPYFPLATIIAFSPEDSFNYPEFQQ